MGTTLGYLTSLYGLGTSTGSGSLLATLYGFPGQKTGNTWQNPASALAAAERNEVRDVKATAAQPMVKRAVDAFAAGVAKAKSVKDLLANPAVMRVLLTANGLGDQAAYTALAQKVLQSDLSNPKSLANTLTDTRWKPVVETYDFANKGLGVIQQRTVIDTISNAYAEVTWRKSLDANTPGLANALSFRERASSITSVYQILGDPVLRDVVTNSLGLPLQIAFQPIETQERTVAARVDIAKFKDAKFVQTFVQRYLLAAASKSAATTTATDFASLSVQRTGLIV